MNNIKSILYKYNLRPYKYSYINKASIIYTDNSKFVIKKNNVDKNSIYTLLMQKDFKYYLLPINDTSDDYEIYNYVDNDNNDINIKAKDLILVLSDLHNKTTSYKKLNLDKIKEIYEDKINRVDYLYKYYSSLEESFILRVYNSPSEYLLLRNIDKIYNTLEYSKILINNWYNEIKNNSNVRYTVNHNHLTLDHFIDGDQMKLINFDYANIDIPIYDLVCFYKNNYNLVDIDTLYKLYISKSYLSYEEELLFFIEIIIPTKLEFTNNNLVNSINTYKLINYLDITREFILKEEQKNKKRDDTEKNQKD